MINTNVTVKYQTAEYGKFVELDNTDFPPVSVVRIQYPDTSSAFSDNYTTQPVSSIDVYPKYGVLTHITNPEDISVSLSAGNVNFQLGALEDLTIVQNSLINGVTAQLANITGYIDDLEGNTFDTASACDDTYREVKRLNTQTQILTTNSYFGTDFSNPSFVSVVNPATQVTTTLEATQLDAFGRLRISSPLTLFDSNHRFQDNGLWTSLTAVSGSVTHRSAQGIIEMTVDGSSGSSVTRETTKIFPYQPGKSLLIMNSFIMAPSAINLRQRVGAFATSNGIYLQLDDGVVSIVKRSFVSGLQETIVPQSSWNGDKLDGTGPSGIKLDITKAQIFWTDIEWLGVGTVRTGFIINGKFIICHSFHHANIIDLTYITSANLPIRYEITNKAATGVTRTLKQVCSTVMSEGGYELKGFQQTAGSSITTPKALTTAGIYYPVISIKLRASPDRLNAIVILTGLSLMGVATGIYNWRLISRCTTSGGGAWQITGSESAIEYKLNGTSVTGGTVLAQGYFTSSQQGSTTIDILKDNIFKYQLERDGLTSTPYELCLAVTASTNTEVVHGSMDWEEVGR
jgi:hypothetical protein